MSQISRPFQIALLAVAVLAAAWLFVFQPHRSDTASSSSSAAVVSSPAPHAKPAGSPSSTYHGSAPGVQGLSRAVAHAHGAVAESQRNAARLQRKAAQASGGTAAATPTHAGAGATKSTASAPAKATPASRPHTTPASKPHAISTKGIPAGQRMVERELAHGKVVVVLFWNHNGAEDEAVRHELRFLQKVHHRKIAINVASAKQTASFGTVTRGVQVYGTPTMLVVNKHGKAIVLSGLQDAFSIEQAINEARRAA
ncbi:MAG TPA: hypothetical protein VFY36_00845 [Solirubrobacteraceae bacterium]|nr:hypothetical protein [Solirubrobacteraceae bacterium]